MRKIIIIGGGMAGMAAALTAAREGAQVLVLERERKPLRKTAASGNGRGNLLNRGKPAYHGCPEYAEKLLETVSPAAVGAFWESVGVPLSEEADGRVYPSSFLAPVAAEALKTAAEEAGVTVSAGARVVELSREKKGFRLTVEQSVFAEDTRRKNGKEKPGELLSVEKQTLRADRVILAAGGKAAPSFGTDGTAYALATGLGHSLTELKPALCPLLTKEKVPSSLVGQRAKATLTLKTPEGETKAASKGEILFTEDGISGIAAMQLARFAEQGDRLEINLTRALLGDGQADHMERMKEFAVIDVSEESMYRLLSQRHARFPNRRGETLFLGMGPKGLRSLIAERAAADGSPECSEKWLKNAAGTILSCPFTLKGNRGWEAAQVTAGGLETADFDPETGESKICRGFYAAGEILNVDGDCGGFNLMLACAGGIACGRAAAGEKKGY